MGPTLPVKEALQGLANSKPAARLDALAALVFAQERLSREAVVVHLERFLPWLKSPDPWMRSSTRDLFQQKISPKALADHFHEIVPALLADPELRPWSFGFLAGRMLPSCLTELIDLMAQQEGSWCKEPATLKFVEGQLPQELDAEHVERILGLLASNDCKVRCWTLNLLNHRVPKTLQPKTREELRTLLLLEEKIPDELIGTYFYKLHPVLRSKDSRISGSSRRMLERRVSADILAEHFHKIVPPLLADTELQLWSFGFLRGRIVARLVPELIDVIFSILCRTEAAWSGEQEALLKFMKASLPSELAAAHVNHIAAFLARPDLKVELRCWTLDLLCKGAGTPHFAEHWDKVLALLASPSCDVQLRILNLLKMKMPSYLITELSTEHRRRLFAFLASPQRLVQQKALHFLEEKMPNELTAKLSTEHRDKLDALLRSPERAVQQQTLNVLAKPISHELISGLSMYHWRHVLRLLAIPSCEQRQRTLNLLHKMSHELIRKHSKQVAELLRDAGHLQKFEVVFRDLLEKRLHQNSLAQLLSKLPISCLLLAMPNDRIASWRFEEGNTWLHVAAKAGHLEACEALVDQVGLPLREKNEAGDEPLGLAATREVDRFLRSRMHFRETRFGYGNAFEEMWQDERQVSEVTWYTVPLPGTAGHWGGLHSFLVVTVSGTDQGAKSYVLEKAGSFGREAHQRHGVFIGSQDLGSNLRSVDGLNVHKQLTLSSRSVRGGLKMKELHELAHGTGPYDLASSNCHHAVQKVFNHCCAREEDQERQPPNEWSATVVAMLGLDGLFNSTSSGSEGSGSDVASANSEVASGSHPADRPCGFTRSVDLRSGVFAEVAAALSLAVYEEDPAIVLRPAEAGAVSIRNKLGRPVILHDHTTQTRLDAAERTCVQTAGADKILVDVYDEECIPGLYSWRRLAKTQPVWSGHAYDLSTDFRGDVVLQEVVSFASRQPVDVLHTAQKSGTNSPVQWLLARSCSVLYVAFRGTNDGQDIVIDLGAVPDCHRFKEYGIGVHGGIAHALEQEGDVICHVVSDVLQALQKHRRPEERLVLCGHSLGGGYAQVMAVHLLSRNVDVAAVRTFGAPHVLVPPARQEDRPTLWCKLDSISQHWVHDWDPVPRLPLCKTWLVDVLPKLKQEVVTGLKVGIGQKYIQALRQTFDETKAKLLERYDVVGEVVLVSKATSVALHASEVSAALKELLGEKPPESVMTLSTLFAYHSMEDYLQIAHKLMAS